MEFISTDLPEIILIIPTQFEDSRGNFLESYRMDLFSEAGISASFVQINQSGSRRGVLRGLHYQVQHPQGKLVRVLSGEVYDIAVDIRCGSRTFGNWVGIYLSRDNKQQLWIPPGFAHGFYVISEWAEVVYNATEYYYPEWERRILWNDPALGIKWPLVDDRPPILSEKDAQGKLLAEAELFD